MSELEELAPMSELTKKAKEALNNPKIVYWLVLAFGVVGLFIVLVYFVFMRRKETKA